jgi:transcription elongation GreA/GreB family factor
VNKDDLMQRIVARLKDDLERLTTAAQATHEDATHEENKAEDKYDTRGLEASYLAMGQARQAEETALSLQAYQALAQRASTAHELVSVGALVSVEVRGRSTHYFIGPRAGGLEIDFDGTTVLVITPQSPLGRQLLNHRRGDAFPLEIGGRKVEARLTAVT